jgi:hypothetical protein
VEGKWKRHCIKQNIVYMLCNEGSCGTWEDDMFIMVLRI